MEKTRTKDKSKKRIWMIILPIVLLVLFAAVSGYSIYRITVNKREHAEGREAYRSLAQSVVKVAATDGTQAEMVLPEKTDKDEPQEITIDVTRPSLIVDFDALTAINPQVVAWISSDNGAINYPVVRGTDNDFYLNHMIDGTSNVNGSIFMDFRNDGEFTDDNTFIYGHNMLDGAMFASLSRYCETGYYKKHPSLLLITPERSYSLQVFAGCVVPGNSDIYQLSYDGGEDFSAYVSKVRSMSQFSSDVEVMAGDRLVTLSTCAYDYDDARYVLFCKLVPMQ